MTDLSLFEKQLVDILAEYADAKGKSQYSDCSDVLDKQQLSVLQTRCLAAIERVGGRSSPYHEAGNRILQERTGKYDHLAGIVGVVQSLLHDLQSGYLKTLEELVHANVFADFLEMADHLTRARYRDAGAVIAGSTLEAHLRKLAAKLGVGVVTSAGNPVKADVLNAEIVKAGGYSKLDQKNVTAWLGLRNDAAHGNYTAYDTNQVTLMIAGIRDFLARNPA